MITSIAFFVIYFGIVCECFRRIVILFQSLTRRYYTEVLPPRFQSVYLGVGILFVAIAAIPLNALSYFLIGLMALTMAVLTAMRAFPAAYYVFPCANGVLSRLVELGYDSNNVVILKSKSYSEVYVRPKLFKQFYTAMEPISAVPSSFLISQALSSIGLLIVLIYFMPRLK